jgi:hypothetical protein
MNGAREDKQAIETVFQMAFQIPGPSVLGTFLLTPMKTNGKARGMDLGITRNWGMP